MYTDPRTSEVEAYIHLCTYVRIQVYVRTSAQIVVPDKRPNKIKKIRVLVYVCMCVYARKEERIAERINAVQHSAAVKIPNCTSSVPIYIYTCINSGASEEDSRA